MPLYEFKCLKCEEFFEILVLKQDEVVEMKCPKCQAQDIERVLSTTNYAMGGAGNRSSASAQTRTCSGGSCTTIDIPGPNG